MKATNQTRFEIGGTGSSIREFLHVDDLAEACLFLMTNYSDGQTINVGFGSDLAVKELACLLKEIVAYTGKIQFDSSKPDTPKNCWTVQRFIVWMETSINLEEGIRTVYGLVDKTTWLTKS